MVEKQKKLSPPNLLEIPAQISEAISGIEEAAKTVDGKLKEIDSAFLSGFPPKGAMPRPEGKEISVNYCGECLSRHFSKAHGLLEEAERFSLKEGRLSAEAAEKVRKAVEELVTSEDDINTTRAPPEIRVKLNEIKDRMRDIRKEMWASKLSFEGSSLDSLRKAKAGVEDLVKRNYDLMAEEAKQEEKAPSLKVPEPKLTAEEKAHVLREVEETSKNLTKTIEALEKEDFKLANESMEKAIESTSCASCQQMIARAGIDVNYIQTLKEIKARDYEKNKKKIIDKLAYIRNDYLPSASEVKEA